MAVEPDTDGSGLSAGPEDTADQHVIDEEHYSHSRRLRVIHNAHDRALDVRSTVEEQVIVGHISERDARRYYRSAVETFVMTVMPVLEKDDISLERDYAESVPLGEVTIRPPPDLVEFARANIGRIPPGSNVPQPTRYEIVGLRSLLDLPSPLGETFSVGVRDGRGGVQTIRRRVTEELSRGLLDRAVQAAADALDDAEMGLNIGADRPHNSLGQDGKWPWEQDTVLPHELYDALESGDISREQLTQLVEGDDDTE